MNRLQRELVRLYGSDGQTAPQRALVLEVARPADWATVGATWQGVQNELGLPAPAIAVNGKDGYQLWFALSEALPPAEGLAFLRGLQRRYLAEVAAERVTCWFDPGAASGWPATPNLLPEGEHWSAFVAPDLAPIFAAEPWLDIPPGDDAQADTLIGLRCMAPADVRSALNQLVLPVATDSAASTQTPAADMPAPTDGAAAPPLNPRDFLNQVMRDPGVPMALRIEAAKALLPFEH